VEAAARVADGSPSTASPTSADEAIEVA
jgi:hypothetical protein